MSIQVMKDVALALGCVAGLITATVFAVCGMVRWINWALDAPMPWGLLLSPAGVASYIFLALIFMAFYTEIRNARKRR